ncbi:hypothetical protein SCUP515_02433 [Seiridium cupressi]
MGQSSGVVTMLTLGQVQHCGVHFSDIKVASERQQRLHQPLASSETLQLVHELWIWLAWAYDELLPSSAGDWRLESPDRGDRVTRSCDDAAGLASVQALSSQPM